MPSLRVLPLAVLSVALAACSTTTITRSDGTTATGFIATSKNGQHVVLDRYGAETEIAADHVQSVRHPGAIRMASGGLLFAAGALGHAVVSSQLAREGVGPFDGTGCEFCGFRLPVTMTILTFGTPLLLHGIALRRESVRQMSFDEGPVGTAHLRLGGAAFAVGVGVLPFLALLYAVDEGPARGAGLGLAGLAPGFILTGIGLMIRGARLKRGREPVVDFTANGFTFDMSL